MVTRFLSFLTDMIVFLFVYCFIFVSTVILLFDRNINYDQFIIPFYLIMGVVAYLYFILPLFFKGQTLGKKVFKISLSTNKGKNNIVKFHVKYLLLRLLPILSVLFFISTDLVILKVLLSIIILYPAFDIIFMSMFDITFTDKFLKLEMKVY